MDRRTLLQSLLSAIGLPPTVVPPPAPPSLHSGEPAPPWLEEWLSIPIQPVLDRLDLTGRVHQEIVRWADMRRAIHLHLSPSIRYHGGSEPGRLRRITPALIFHKITGEKAPPLYVLAWCHRRNQHRTFRLDRMETPADYRAES